MTNDVHDLFKPAGITASPEAPVPPKPLEKKYTVSVGLKRPELFIDKETLQTILETTPILQAFFATTSPQGYTHYRVTGVIDSQKFLGVKVLRYKGKEDDD